MANRYYQKNSPTKGDGANGSTESLKGSKAEQKAPKIVAHPSNVVKDGMGFGNKAGQKEKIGQAKHD